MPFLILWTRWRSDGGRTGLLLEKAAPHFVFPIFRSFAATASGAGGRPEPPGAREGHQQRGWHSPRGLHAPVGRPADRKRCRGRSARAEEPLQGERRVIGRFFFHFMDWAGCGGEEIVKGQSGACPCAPCNAASCDTVSKSRWNRVKLCENICQNYAKIEVKKWLKMCETVWKYLPKCAKMEMKKWLKMCETVWKYLPKCAKIAMKIWLKMCETVWKCMPKLCQNQGAHCKKTIDVKQM